MAVEHINTKYKKEDVENNLRKAPINNYFQWLGSMKTVEQKDRCLYKCTLPSK